jgi:phosphatidylinositol alpha-1,6-mannosyltransferase
MGRSRNESPLPTGSADQLLRPASPTGVCRPVRFEEVPPSFLLTYDFPPMGGGIARWMGEAARRFPPGSLLVSTGSVPGSEAIDRALPNPVDRIRIPARRLRTLRGLLFWSRRVTALARDQHPGFVWCGQLRPAAYPAKWLSERLGTPYGIMVHGGDLLSLQHRIHQSRVKRGTARSLIGSASVLVANSRWTGELCQVVLGELELDPAPDFVRVVPLGTDPSQFKPGLPTEEVRARHRLDGDGRWMLTVARLVPHKGVDVTLHALAGLANEHPDLRYAVVGQGQHQAELESLAAGLGLSQRVRFLTDVTDDDLPGLYNVADLYVGVSRQAGLDVEGFGIALLEASASGLPVVAGRSGGMRDAVQDGQTGVLVDSEDPRAVAAAIGGLLRDRPRSRELGQAGRRAVEQRFTWDRVVTDLQAIASEFNASRRSAPLR